MSGRRFSRRRFLGRTAAAAGVCVGGAVLCGRAWSAPGVLTGPIRSQAKRRPELCDEKSPKALEVIQLTAEPEVPSSHLYMEAQIFTPDSKRLVLHRAAHAHGGIRGDAKHQYLLCDLEDNFSLAPLTNEMGTTAASVSPDGRFVYYFVDESEPGGGRVSLKRVGLDGTDRQTLLVIDSPLPGTKFRPSHLYPLSTISSDGKRLAISAFLGDGRTEKSPFGLMVFDLVKASVALAVYGPSWCNMHPQYSRSLDPEASHDILIQENHDNEANARGGITRLTGGAGADIHVIRDDGKDFRDMPWGRDKNEYCQGHQCWRGRSEWAITSTSTSDVGEAQLIEGRAAAAAGHRGIRIPDGKRNDLTREFPKPDFRHFATDIAGERLISDTGPRNKGGQIYVARLGRPGVDPLREYTYLLNPRSTWRKEAHIHPFLSPDGTMGFFNSDESGILQAYMVRGF